MKIKTVTIEENGFDLRKEMHVHGHTFRSLGKKTNLHFTYLSKLSNGLPCSKETYLMIRNRLIEPEPTQINR